MRLGLAWCALVLSATSALAQPPGEYLSLSSEASKAGQDCSGGTSYDDGSFESAYKFNSFAVSTGSYVMAFDFATAGKVQAVCLCWLRSSSITDPTTDIAFTVKVWDDDGPGGRPGTLLGESVSTARNVPLSPAFFRTDVNISVPAGRVWIGPEWHPGAASFFYLCADQNGPTVQPAYRSESASAPSQNLQGVFPDYKTLGIRAEFTAGPPPPPEDPDPPSGPWLTTSQLPGYQFKVRISGGAAGTQVADCVPETLCVAGAIPTRSELFLRIIGPRPNGFLWAQVVRFSTSRLEVWVQRLSTGEINYYDLPAVPQDSAELPGLVDKEAFQP